MFCAQCGERILGEAVRQWDEAYCSIGCAGLASGINPEEANEYFEEDDLSADFFSEEDE